MVTKRKIQKRKNAMGNNFLTGYFPTDQGRIPILSDGNDDITIIAMPFGSLEVHGIFEVNQLHRARKLIKKRFRNPRAYRYMVVLENEDFTRDYGFFVDCERYNKINDIIFAGMASENV